jgi:hypothetical protein
MFRVLSTISVLLAICALLANPVYRAKMGYEHGAGGHLSDAAGNLTHDQNGSRDNPLRHGALDCLSFNCAPTLFIQPPNAQPWFAPSIAFMLTAGNDVLRSANLERDPPIPRFSV